jgi:hypothetical protein
LNQKGVCAMKEGANTFFLSKQQIFAQISKENGEHPTDFG